MHRTTRSILVGTAISALAAPALATDPAEVRVIHASPDAPAVDVRVDGTLAFPNLAFTGVTEYAELLPDTYDVTVTPAGAESPVVIDAPLTLEDGTSYTVLAIDRLESIEPLVLEDLRDPDPEIPAIRFVHASPNAPAVDIAIAGSVPLALGELEFRDATGYLSLPPGTYDLEVRLAGTSTVVLPIDDVTITGGRTYTAAVVGLVNEEPSLSALIAVDAADSFDVSVVHASPDAPAVDVLVDDAPAFTGVGFTEDAGPATLPADTYNLKVVPAGASEPVVIDADVAFEPNRSYTVVAVDELASIEPLVLENDLTLDDENARVRFAHASPNTPAVDVALEDGPVIFPNASFTDVTDYLATPAGDYDLEVRLAGTDTVVLDVPTLSLDVNTVYTVYAMGFAGGEPPLQAVVKVEARGEARVRAVHLSPDAPNVDVLVDGAVAFADLPFTGVSPYATLPAREIGVEVVPAGASDPVVIDETLELEPGTDYSVLAVNVLAAIDELVLIDDNTTDPQVGRVRFVHASPNAPPVDIALANGGPVLFGNVAFTQVGDYLDVAPGTYDLEVRLAGTDAVVLPLPGIVVRPNTVVTAYAAGLVAGDPGLQAVLSLDAEGCTGDLNADGSVDFADLVHLLDAFGASGDGADLDGSGAVDFGDLLSLLGAFGDC